LKYIRKNLSLCNFRNALMYAVRCDSEDLVKLLLEKGVDFHFQDAHRWTALKYAVEGRCKV
jgi:POTE ankyrin domain family protein